MPEQHKEALAVTAPSIKSLASRFGKGALRSHPQASWRVARVADRALFTKIAGSPEEKAWRVLCPSGWQKEREPRSRQRIGTARTERKAGDIPTSKLRWSKSLAAGRRGHSDEGPEVATQIATQTPRGIPSCVNQKAGKLRISRDEGVQRNTRNTTVSALGDRAAVMRARRTKARGGSPARGPCSIGQLNLRLQRLRRGASARSLKRAPV